MTVDSDRFDFFVSYSRRDNANGWISEFIRPLLIEHQQATGSSGLTYFLDTEEIKNFDDWRQRIYHALSASRVYVAFLSPHFFASEWCRREWRAWLDIEIAKHILSSGAAPVYIVEVPGLLNEHETDESVARAVASICEVSEPRADFVEATALVVRQIRRRQFMTAVSLYKQGMASFQDESMKAVLRDLATDLNERVSRVRAAGASVSTVPPYNARFAGRHDELMWLRERLTDNRAGVITGVHGLGGIGKTELAFTFAHAFASAYPGGRFLIPCEGKVSLRDAALHLGELFADRITDKQRETLETYFAAISAALRERLEALGHVLVVLDNVTAHALLTLQETDVLTSLGSNLHLLATTRLAAPAGTRWLPLGELSEQEALELLEKHRAPTDVAAKEAARRIVRRLGGFTLAVELVAAWLALHPTVTYASMLERIGLEDLEALDKLAEDRDVELRRHNHERRITRVLESTLSALNEIARRALDYAALMPADQVPLSWLKELVAQDHPRLLRVPQPGYEHDWDAAVRQLKSLTLFSRGESETDGDAVTTSGAAHKTPIVRVHRLVQDFVRSRTEHQHSGVQRQLAELVERRIAALKQVTAWEDARWELGPLEALAVQWAGAGNAKAVWLLDETALLLSLLGQWTRAETLIRRALAINEEIHGAEDPKVATSLNRLALLLKETGRISEAVSVTNRALAIDEAAHGPNHLYVATHLNNIAALYELANRHTDAEPLMQRALAIFETNNPEANSDQLAGALKTHARVLRALNRLTEAEPVMRRAVKIIEAKYGTDHPRITHALNNLVELLLEMNRFEEAERLVQRALAIDEATYGRRHHNVAWGLNLLAQTFAHDNRLVDAELAMREALDIDEEVYGPNHPNVERDRANLELVLRLRRHIAE